MEQDVWLSSLQEKLVADSAMFYIKHANALQGRDLSFQKQISKQMTTLRLYMETDDYVFYRLIMCLSMAKWYMIFYQIKIKSLWKSIMEINVFFRTRSHTYKLYSLRYTWLVSYENDINKHDSMINAYHIIFKMC